MTADPVTGPVRPALVRELPPDPDEISPGGSPTWITRAQNFCVAYSELVAGDEFVATDVPDEHLVLLLDDAPAMVSGDTGLAIRVDVAACVVMPAGSSAVHAVRSCRVLHVFSAAAQDFLARAGNHDTYDPPDPNVDPLPTEAGQPVRAPKVLPLRDVPNDPARFGRIFRSARLMVNWFEPRHGPRDTDSLSPHAHDGFEQVSVTLRGDYVHHFRTPWTARLRDWLPDAHVSCGSPSIAIIPPGLVHTTRAVGPGRHELVDIFAPPRDDFRARGWVLNENQYPGGLTMADPHSASPRAQLTAVVIGLWYDIDHRGGAGAAGFFTPDAALTLGEHTVRGRDGIERLYADRRARGPRQSRHLATNLHVTEVAADRASVLSTLLLFAADGGAPRRTVEPTAVADVADEFERHNGSWLIAARRLTFVFLPADPDFAVPTGVSDDHPR